MKVLILGDCHGEWGETNVVVARSLRAHPDITHIIQVGDFGYAWSGSKPLSWLPKYMTDETLELVNNIPCYWLDGNHENLDQLDQDGGAWQPGWTHQGRGSVLTIEDHKLLFCGGAYSPDNGTRTEGKTWWTQETISYNTIKTVIDTLEGRVDALFTHDFPYEIPYYGDNDSTIRNPMTKGNRMMLEILREQYKPDWCFFGHHHRYACGTIRGLDYHTAWHCAPIINSRQVLIWDGTTVKHENLGASPHFRMEDYL